jgi:pyruvate kinase
MDDGLIETEVTGRKGGDLLVRIKNNGILGSKKTVCINGHDVKLPFFTETDREDILFGIENDIPLIAASFVRCKEDVRELRSLLIQHNSKAMIISKIEHGEAVRNIDEIIRESDGIMIARGDLGVELPLEKVPKIQAEIISACNRLGKPVIVATQMLESMRENPRPTRAEVSDIAQAILQGADAIMLSAETATGKYPIKAVETMVQIAKEYDMRVKGVIDQNEKDSIIGEDSVAQFVAKAAYYGSVDLGTRAVLTPTESGFTARNVSRFKPHCPILATTRDVNVMQQLMLSWGVFPMLEQEKFDSTDDMTNGLVLKSYEKGLIDITDRIVITSGNKLLEKGGTNHLEIYTVRDILERIGKKDTNHRNHS